MLVYPATQHSASSRHGMVPIISGIEQKGKLLSLQNMKRDAAHKKKD